MDDFEENEDYLQHYGVMGMKWGVRNAETQARYAGANRAKKAISKAASKTAKAAGNVTSSAKKKLKNRIQTYRENKKIAKSLGYKKVSEYKQARLMALYSHDPATVARGMKTLTDKELANKVKRLSEEKKIINLIPPKTKSIGAEALQNFARTAAVTAGKTIGTNIGNRIASNNSGNKNETQSEAKKKTSFKEASNISNKKPSSSSKATKSSGNKASRFSNKKPSLVPKTIKANGKSVLDYYKDSPIKLLPGDPDFTDFQNDKNKK